MPLPACVDELRSRWLPHVTRSGLDRVIELLESRSPLLIHGAFTAALPMGCLASHIAWHHPSTEGHTLEGGILWLTGVAGLNPATSAVIRNWDDAGPQDWELRNTLLDEFRAERERRQAVEREGHIDPVRMNAAIQ